MIGPLAAFFNEKQQTWITAYVHMYEYFGGVTRILVLDNCKTSDIHTNDWYNQQVNAELNKAIRKKLDAFSHRPFQMREGDRYDTFRNEGLPLLAKLLACRWVR